MDCLSLWCSLAVPICSRLCFSLFYLPVAIFDRARAAAPAAAAAGEPTIRTDPTQTEPPPTRGQPVSLHCPHRWRPPTRNRHGTPTAIRSTTRDSCTRERSAERTTTERAERSRAIECERECCIAMVGRCIAALSVRHCCPCSPTDIEAEDVLECAAELGQLAENGGGGGGRLSGCSGIGCCCWLHSILQLQLLQLLWWMRRSLQCLLECVDALADAGQAEHDGRWGEWARGAEAAVRGSVRPKRCGCVSESRQSHCQRCTSIHPCHPLSVGSGQQSLSEWRIARAEASG